MFKQLWKKLAVAFVLGLAVATPIIAATYTQTVLTDGVNVWTFLSANSSASSQMAVQRNGVTVFTFDPVNGAMLLSGLTAALPTCVTALTGAVRVVTDSNSTTIGGTVAGSGSTTVLAICNGTNWINN